MVFPMGLPGSQSPEVLKHIPHCKLKEKVSKGKMVITRYLAYSPLKLKEKVSK